MSEESHVAKPQRREPTQIVRQQKAPVLNLASCGQFEATGQPHKATAGAGRATSTSLTPVPTVAKCGEAACLLQLDILSWQVASVQRHDVAFRPEREASYAEALQELA